MATEASRQYSQLSCYDGVRSDWEKRTFHHIPTQRGGYALQRIKFENLRDSETKRMTSLLAQGNSAAQAFYQEHQADLYEMAREEMEAEGISLRTEDDTYEMTKYYYNEEIADLELEDPFMALGAKIIHIGQKYIELANAELGRTPEAQPEIPPVISTVTG